ncbi:hypothetical protein CHLNCDRAFT_137823 [Chlorella variabilis]|uniref:THIF-type NAD/FAD binding fold domain-containing protein n=1 Tax=Chlorella variabilis TaxID=554065 RepID=E1Z4K8_CHLVA|nr:hypothetical protein CHLNCDRAFT_137823 [Chlorella variabilis]EFN59362.1 hypothetical protein CHLNCDRAFT_137823 [Chlorella variabilis]|eukprot:XP_005851464.1 hypothetical protein CHLNCDRAFT_137823 [Chlorella variabilis]
MSREASLSGDTSTPTHSLALSGEMAVDKSKRYDRGIRVWGAHGQEALEAARVCLLNAGPTGTEALKNLVLGGIHSFTIVDGAKVTAADLGNNFLLTADSLAGSRARLSNPWPELARYVEGVDLASAEDQLHSHVPYAVLLAKAAKQWQEQHDGKLPGSYPERAAFKDMIRSWQRHIDGIPLEEENFAEAASNAHKVWAPPTVSPELRASPGFWVLVAALRRFIEGEGKGLLPLEGSIPDMHASTQQYLELQRIYRAKADADAAAVEAHARAILEGAGRDPAAIPAADIKHFCKHARYLRLVRCRSLAEETGAGSCRGGALRAALAAEDTAASAALYVLLRAADRFHQTYQRYPGSYDSEVEEDAALLKSQAQALLAECGAGGGAAGVADDLVGEVCRCAAGELHVVAAVVGAVAAQEAIKIVTGQFVPLGGVLIYNAMACTSSVFAF